MNHIKVKAKGCWNSNRSNSAQFATQVETLEDNEPYTLVVENFEDEKESQKCFELLFSKQRPNLIKMNLFSVNLLPNSFRLFTEKNWQKLIKIEFCKLCFIQISSTSAMSVSNFCPNAKCPL